MRNNDFQGQYINFFCAYYVASTGWNTCKEFGVVPFVVLLFALAIGFYIYIFKTAIVKMRIRIYQNSIPMRIVAQQFCINLFFYLFMSVAGVVLINIAGEFWQLRLF